MSDRKRDEPVIDWVNTGAGGETEPGSESAGGTVGSGANRITRAGLPNADPDGLDYDSPENTAPDETPDAAPRNRPVP